MTRVTDDLGTARELMVNRDLVHDWDQQAAEVRHRLDRSGTRMLEFMGSVGAGKTSLLEALVQRLRDKRLVVVNGDLATTVDQERLQRHGVHAIQVNTGTQCHLDAITLDGVLAGLPLEESDLVLVENVGNLICPASFPLGAHRRVVVVSLADGPYVIQKHPHVFARADWVVVNKIDLASAMDMDPLSMEETARALAPRARTMSVSCRDGRGLDLVEAAVRELLSGA